MTKSSSNVLIFCKDLFSLKMLNNIEPASKTNYTIASDDFNVHQEIYKFNWIDSAVYIDSIDSLHTVSKDVINFIKIINQWFSEYDNIIPYKVERVIYWTQHVEGGFTTQRIQDLLLLINSYEKLIELNQISKVEIFSSGPLKWEEKVFIEFVKAKKIPVEITIKRNFKILVKIFFSKSNVFLVTLYYLLNSIKIMLTTIKSSRKKLDKEILIKLCGTLPKHLHNIVPFIESLKKHDLVPIPISWGNYSSPNKSSTFGNKIIYLESYLSLKDIFNSIYLSIKVFVKMKKDKQEFLSKKELRYSSMQIGGLLWDSIKYFSIVELSQRIRYIRAASSFLKKHNPRAIKFCTTILPEDDYLYQLTEHKKDIIKIWWPIYPTSIIAPYDYQIMPIDLTFVLSKWHKLQIAKKYNAGKISIIGPYLEKKTDSQIAQKESQVKLGIPVNFNNYVLVESSYTSRGYISINEQALLLNYILSKAKLDKETAFIIKPHPGHKKNNLEEVLSSNCTNNIYLVDNKSLPFDAINASDFIITKNSFIGIEAMYLNKPVISLILDRARGFKAYYNASQYLYNINDLDTLLTKILNDNNYKLKWSKIFNRKSKILLKKFEFDSKISPYSMMAKEVYNSLN